MSGHRAPDLLLNDEQKMLSKTARSFIRDRAPASRIRKLREFIQPGGHPGLRRIDEGDEQGARR